MNYAPESIAILLHERDRNAEKRNYLVWWLRAVWKRMGIEVRLVRGVASPIEADVLLPHVDLTVLPAEYVRVVGEHPHALNRTVTDIGKSVVSSMAVEPGDGWGGPVIVKTERNCGGRLERRLLPREPLRRVRKLLGRVGPGLRFARELDPGAYRVYPTAADVPRAVFRNPALFVERFLPERDGEGYVRRMYTFLGDREVSERRVGDSPVVHGAAFRRAEPIASDEAMRAQRRRFGFDYGSFDYVLHDDRAVLIDVNRTPTLDGVEPGTALDDLPEDSRRTVWLLAEGILEPGLQTAGPV